MDKRILRLVDANSNRLLEALRVCEDIERFIRCDPGLTLKFKRLRHKASALVRSWNKDRQEILSSRNSQADVGRPSISRELKRSNYQDIFYANIQRGKESARVLEEFSKLSGRKISAAFKDTRYRLYQLEKEASARK